MVNEDVPDNVVYAGNPGRVIMSIEEYHSKRHECQLEEAMELVRLYRKRYGKEPDENALHEFFWLFEDNPANLPDCWKKMMRLHGNAEECNKKLRNHTKVFQSMRDFLEKV